MNEALPETGNAPAADTSCEDAVMDWATPSNIKQNVYAAFVSNDAPVNVTSCPATPVAEPRVSVPACTAEGAKNTSTAMKRPVRSVVVYFIYDFFSNIILYFY